MILREGGVIPGVTLRPVQADELALVASTWKQAAMRGLRGVLPREVCWAMVNTAVDALLDETTPTVAVSSSDGVDVVLGYRAGRFVYVKPKYHGMGVWEMLQCDE